MCFSVEWSVGTFSRMWNYLFCLKAQLVCDSVILWDKEGSCTGDEWRVINDIGHFYLWLLHIYDRLRWRMVVDCLTDACGWVFTAVGVSVEKHCWDKTCCFSYLHQWCSTSGTCTPTSMWAYCRGYMETIINLFPIWKEKFPGHFISPLLKWYIHTTTSEGSTWQKAGNNWFTT